MATKPRHPITSALHPQQSIRSLVILLLLVLTTAQCADAQRSPPSVTDPNESKPFNASTAFIVVVVIIGLFCGGFFSVYFRRCSSLLGVDAAAEADGNRPARSDAVKRGLDPDKLASFPTMPYAEVRELKLGMGVLECAVCLCQFEDDETLKMLPSCSHVYHPDCIDAWLASHVTCPVCRSNLAAAADDNAAPADHVAIEVVEDQVEEAADLARIGSRKRKMRARSTRMVRIPRSRSEGNMEAGMEKFTLRLPEQVKKEITIEFRRAASCAVGRSGRRISWTFSTRPATKREQRD